jgi:oleate hydratase
MTDKKAYFVGTGMGNMCAAVFLIRDGGFEGKNLIMLEDLNVAGGSCDASGGPENGYVCRGGRMFNEPTFECM